MAKAKRERPRSEQGEDYCVRCNRNREPDVDLNGRTIYVCPECGSTVVVPRLHAPSRWGNLG